MNRVGMKRYAYWLHSVVMVWSVTTSASSFGQVVTLEGQQALAEHLTDACDALSGRLSRYGQAAGCGMTTVSRQPLTADVAEYRYEFQVGPQAEDVIVLHRVVRERTAGVPASTGKNVFAVHGDIFGFNPAFLGQNLSSNSVTNSFAVTAALAGIDVWGIDLRWVQVPAGTTDFSFMQNWNLQTYIQDVGVGLTVARVVRALTGSGFGKMNLLGWSRGQAIGYAYLNYEATIPTLLRNVKGFIPVEGFFKSDDANLRAGSCARLTTYTALQTTQPQTENGVLTATLAVLAQTDPSGASPILAGLTNEQAVLFFGTLTFNIFAPDPAPTDLYHFNGGVFDPVTQLPVGLAYTQQSYYYDFLTLAAPYQSLGEVIDTETLVCDQVDLPYDDHLADVTVPVLYVGAAGAFGNAGLYSTTLLGSTDVSSHIVSLYPAAQKLLDYGHADVWTADDADSLVWPAVIQWVQAH